MTSHEIGRRDTWDARDGVINDVRVGYYEACWPKGRSGQRTATGRREQLLKAARARDARSQRSDVLQARVEMENAQLNLAQARDRHHSTWRRLAAVLGRPEMEPAPLAGEVTGNLPVITWEEALSRLLAQSPELAEARATVNRAECDLALQCAERYPNFDAGAAVKKDTGTGFTVVDVAIGMPLPVFNRNQGILCERGAALASARNRDQAGRAGAARAARHGVRAIRRRPGAGLRQFDHNARRSLELTTTGYREASLHTSPC